MNPFFIIIPFLIFMAFIGSNTIEENNSSIETKIENPDKIYYRIISIIMLLVFWGLTAFRSVNIGNDTVTYIKTFKRISYYGVMDTLYMEKGFQYFSFIISRIFGTDGHAFLIICASIGYISVGVFILKKSQNYFISICLTFVFLFSCYTNTLRQGIAMSIGVLVYIFLQKGRKLLPIILIILAMQFHYTAVILFSLFLFKFTPKKFRTVFIVSIVLLFISISGIFNHFIMLLIPHGQSYFGSARVGTGYLALSYELIRDLIFCYFAYLAYEENRTDENLRRMMLFVVCVITTSISFGMNLIARANGYMLILQVVELANVFMNMKNVNKRIYTFLSCAVMLLYFIVVQLLRPEWNHLLPYEFWKSY
ncbi:MAG: EpsG family protein [Lachnospiraceae bacterium]|nr:EpsG family protein [Lachnospiraceae bacterium]MCM1230372.1 EpsG family protein [Ruminococcus flavefaciens]